MKRMRDMKARTREGEQILTQRRKVAKVGRSGKGDGSRGRGDGELPTNLHEWQKNLKREGSRGRGGRKAHAEKGRRGVPQIGVSP